MEFKIEDFLVKTYAEMIDYESPNHDLLFKFIAPENINAVFRADEKTLIKFYIAIFNKLYKIRNKLNNIILKLLFTEKLEELNLPENVSANLYAKFLKVFKLLETKKEDKKSQDFNQFLKDPQNKKEIETEIIKIIDAGFKNNKSPEETALTLEKYHDYLIENQDFLEKEFIQNLGKNPKDNISNNNQKINPTVEIFIDNDIVNYFVSDDFKNIYLNIFKELYDFDNINSSIVLDKFIQILKSKNLGKEKTTELIFTVKIIHEYLASDEFDLNDFLPDELKKQILINLFLEEKSKSFLPKGKYREKYLDTLLLLKKYNINITYQNILEIFKFAIDNANESKSYKDCLNKFVLNIWEDIAETSNDNFTLDELHSILMGNLSAIEQCIEENGGYTRVNLLVSTKDNFMAIDKLSGKLFKKDDIHKPTIEAEKLIIELNFSSKN